LFFLSIFLVIVYSRVLEVSLHNNYRVPLICGACAAFFAIFSGNIPRVASSWIARTMAAFTIWFIVCIPFAYWRRGSLDLLTDRWLKSLTVFFAIALLIGTLDQLRNFYRLFFLAIAFAGILTIPYGAMHEGRLGMNNGELSNANQLAMVALMGLPFALVLIGDTTRSRLLRATAACSSVLLVIIVFRTGSRTGLLCLVLLAVVMFWILPSSSKVLALFGMGMMLVLALAFVPEQISVRLGTMFMADNDMVSIQDAEVLNSSRESTENRIQVIREGIGYTIENPIFGLGPGNFEERRNADYNARYGHQGFLASHNSYVQTASEMGFPGAVIFITLMVLCYRSVTRIYTRFKVPATPQQLQIRNLALGLRLCTITMATFSFFNHIAYDLYIPTLAGMLVAFEQILASNSFATPRPASSVSQAFGPFAPAVQPVFSAVTGNLPQVVSAPAASGPGSRRFKFGRPRTPAPPQASINS